MPLFQKIERILSILDIETTPNERKETFNPLVEFIQNKVNANQEIRINFICTHNSRRSHLSQVWAQTMAYHFNIKNVFCYSGGTESTRLSPMAAKTLTNLGFEVKTIAEGNNPIYTIKYAENEHPIIGFSKKSDDDFNTKSELATVMTCSQADGDCPFIAGAEKHIPITYEDIKVFDNTPQQAKKHRKKSLQIATELFYVFSQIQW